MLVHPKLLFYALAVLCAAIAFPRGIPAQSTQPSQSRAARIASTDESSLVTLKGNHHPLAIAANDRGEVPPDLPMQRMLLVLQRDPDSESSLRRLIVAQQDKSSPNFHAWLSPEQFAAQFSPATAEVQKVTGWLTSHGFRINRVTRGGMAIEFDGTATQVKEAFRTPIHSYVVNGEKHYANSSDPKIPAALAPVVAGVSSLHNFQKQPPIRVLGSVTRIGNTSTWQPNFTLNATAGPFHYLAPGDFAKIYDLAPLYKAGTDGSGQTIAIVGRNNINMSDIQIFRLVFGLPTNDPQIILDGPDPGNLLGSSDETEADLDVEWSGAIAPKASIKFVVSASTNSTDGVDLSALYIVDNNLAPILSMSFGECEFGLGSAENTFFNNLWQQAAAQGITVIVASGDNGPAGCDDPSQGQPASHGPAVSGLASTPYNIAVGGTEFNENNADSTYWSATNGPDQASALSYIPEQVWNESCADDTQCGFVSLFASSGGPSSLYTKPSWQSGPGVPNDGLRDLPDVALPAAGMHDGLLLCQDGVCLTDGTGQLISAEVVGGTSASAPAFAAIMAFVVQSTNSRQGQANFVLYPLAAGENDTNCNASAPPQSQCIFYDITQGNNNVPGQAGVSATPGYDMATGLGSINAANLVGSWHNITFRGSTTTLTVTPTAVTHGQPVNVSATVAPSTGTGVPSGGVALLTGSQNVNLGVLTNGSILSPVSSLPGGSYSVIASYGGDSTFGASMSNSVAVTVAPESSATSFSVGGSTTTTSFSTTYTAPVALNAVVSSASHQGTPTGTVVVSDTLNGNTTTLMTVPLNSQGNLTVDAFPSVLGTHTLSAAYSGDSSFQPSSSGSVTLSVAKGPTSTLLFIPTGALSNSSVVLQAIVIPSQGTALPTGSVQFFVGGKAFGNALTLQNELVSLATKQLPPGSDSISASYTGDSNYNSSNSSTQSIFIGNPTFQISVNPGNVTVSSSTPGSITVYVTPSPAFGFAGPVSFTCSGLPVGTSCTFVPAQVNLDGFTPSSTVLTISKSNGSTGALRHSALPLPGRMIMIVSALVALVALCLVACFCPLPWSSAFASARRTSVWLAAALLAAVVGIVIGCGGGSSSPTGPTSTGPTSSVVTVVASGGSGTTATNQSVTVGVTFQ